MTTGHIQKSILTLITRHGEEGVYIGAGTQAKELRGLTLEQVEDSLQRLLDRGIIVREGIRYKAKK